MQKISFLSLTLLLLCLPLIAQENLGRVAGTITDETGGVIQGAGVTARNEATGVETSVVSNDSGAYFFPTLVIGFYTVTAGLDGFKTVEQVGVRVVSGGAVTLDITLPVGEVKDTVTVEGGALGVDTQSSSAGVTRFEEEIEVLPLAVSLEARHSLSLTRTLPGFSFWPYQTERMATDMGIVNGVVGTLSMKIDGIYASPQTFMGMSDQSPLIPEAISEFRTVSNLNAEHGWNLGSSVEMVMKSGTNEFHGSLFEFFRNDALDARNFFAADVSAHKQNELGGIVGGPIVKNKHFFMVSYTAFRLRRVAAGVSATVPTELMKNGDFSELLGGQIGTDVLGRPIFRGQIYDPLSTRSDGLGGFVRDPFPGNIIPSNRISPISAAFQAGYPLPNRPGTQNNWVGSRAPAHKDTDKITLKTDHEMTDKWKFSFGMDWNRRDVVQADFGGGWDERITNTSVSPGKQYRYRFANSFTLRPNLLLSVRFAVQRVRRVFGKTGNAYGADNGLTGVLTPETPSTNIQGTTGFGIPVQEHWDPGTTVPGYVDLSWTRGNHNYKMGAQVRQSIVTFRSKVLTNGNWSFRDITTGLAAGQAMDGSGKVSPFPDVALTGSGYASYLLGDVDSAFMNSPEGNRFNSRTYAVFFQDTWRAASNLTVNYGIRYAWWDPFGESYDRMGWFDPGTPNPGAAGRPGAMTFLGDGPGRNGRTRAFDRYYGALGPRLGLAYALDDKTVLRSYYGIAYADPTHEYNTGGARIPQLGWGVTVDIRSLNGGVTPAFNWNDGFPDVGLETIASLPSTDPALLNGGFVPWIDPADNKWTRTHNLGAGIERELGWNVLLKADYVGKLGRNAPVQWDRNQIPVEVYGLGPVIFAPIDSPEGQATGIPIPYAGFSGSVFQASRPYPQYCCVTQRPAHSGITSYHALNFSARKRFGQGFGFLLAHTLSKNLHSGRGGGVFSPPRVVPEGYGGIKANYLRDLDRTHNFALTWSYHLPFGQGQRWGSGVSGVANQIMANWRVIGWHNYMSGAPIFLGPVNRTGASISTGVSHGSYDPNGPRQNTLNVDAFSPQNIFLSFGDTDQLPDIRGFGYSTENLSILKDFQVTEVNIR